MTNNTRKFLNIVLVAAVAATMSVAAQAAPSSAMQGWAKNAGQAVDQRMTYPAMAVRQGAEGQAHFTVTVDRSGKVVNSVMTASANNALLNGAAKSVVQHTEFPALPMGYAKDTMTFGLQLSYQIANSAAEERALRREGHVTGERIARAGGASYAAIILEDDGAAD